MRLFWRIVFIITGITLLVLCLWIFQPALWFAERNIDAQHQLTQPKDLKVSLAYQLSDTNWVSFPLGSAGNMVKVISNAVLPGDYKPMVEESWIYAIEYELLDAQNKIVLSGDIYHKTGQNIFLDPESNQQFVSSTFYSTELNPVDARLHIINYKGYGEPIKIRLRTRFQPNPLVGVIIRLYQKEHISEHKLSYLWQRIGEAKRKYLAKASVYEQELLSDKEKWLVMQAQWEPVGPLGSNDKDYTGIKLYVARDVEEDVVINLPVVPPEGLVVYPGKYGVVNIPVFSGAVKLQWQALESGSSSDKVSIEWWGHPSTRHKQWQSDLKTGEFRASLDSGVVQISTTTPIVFRVWMHADKKPVEITPTATYVRVYQPEKSPVVYNINHRNNKDTPFRLDLRTNLSSGDDAVEYRLINARNEIVKSGSLKIASRISPYDIVVGDERRVISNPVSYYFNLPSVISRVELYANSAMWVSAYTRPAELPLKLDYPYKQENATNQDLIIPSWYFVRPNQWKEYVAAGRSVLLNVQTRPPEIDPLLMAGQFRWDQYLPQGNWRGRELLTSYDDGLPAREQSMGSHYAEMPIGTENRIELKGYSGESFVTPQLMYLQKERTALNIKVWLNDKLYFNEVLHAKDGEISMPPVAPGQYKIKIETDGQSMVLIDHVAGQGTGFLKRMAIKYDRQPLEFSYLKEHDEELIAVRVYAQPDDHTPQQIQLDIKDIGKRGMGPFASWTFADRQYLLAGTDGPVARVLQSDERELAPAKLFFVPLGEDLPKGRTYLITIKLKSGPPGYVILTRTLPGRFDSLITRYAKTINE